MDSYKSKNLNQSESLHAEIANEQNNFANTTTQKASLEGAHFQESASDISQVRSSIAQRIPNSLDAGVLLLDGGKTISKFDFDTEEYRKRVENLPKEISAYREYIDALDQNLRLRKEALDKASTKEKKKEAYQIKLEEYEELSKKAAEHREELEKLLEARKYPKENLAFVETTSKVLSYLQLYEDKDLADFTTNADQIPLFLERMVEIHNWLTTANDFEWGTNAVLEYLPAVEEARESLAAVVQKIFLYYNDKQGGIPDQNNLYFRNKDDFLTILEGTDYAKKVEAVSQFYAYKQADEDVNKINQTKNSPAVGTNELSFEISAYFRSFETRMDDARAFLFEYGNARVKAQMEVYRLAKDILKNMPKNVADPECMAYILALNSEAGWKYYQYTSMQMNMSDCNVSEGSVNALIGEGSAAAMKELGYDASFFDQIESNIHKTYNIVKKMGDGRADYAILDQMHNYFNVTMSVTYKMLFSSVAPSTEDAVKDIAHAQKKLKNCTPELQGIASDLNDFVSESQLKKPRSSRLVESAKSLYDKIASYLRVYKQNPAPDGIDTGDLTDLADAAKRFLISKGKV